MKRTIALLAALGCLNVLGGCTAATEPPASTQQTAETAAAATPSGTLPLSLASPCTDQGIYNVGMNDSLGTGLYFLDYETAENRILCDQPGCRHDSDACPGRAGAGFYRNMLCALPDGSLVYGVSGEGSLGVTLWVAEDGSRRELGQVEHLANLLFTDGESLYVEQWATEPGESNSLARVSLADGAVTSLGAMPLQSPYNLLGTAGREVLARQTQWEEMPQLDIPEDATAEEVQALQEAYNEEVSQSTADHRLFLWDPDTGAQRDLDTWTSHYGSTGRTMLWDGERLYWCSDVQPDDLHWMTLDGETGTLPVAWPQEVLTSGQDTVFYLEDVLSGQLLLTVWGPWGTDTVKRYALDLTDGALQEVPLYYVSNAKEQPVTILAHGPEDLAVAFAEQRRQESYIDSDGQLATTEKVTVRFGVLTIQDFLAGNPDYREVTQEGTTAE